MEDNYKIDDYTKQAINSRSMDIFKAYGVELIRGRSRCPFPDHPDETPSFIAGRKDKTGRYFWSCLGGCKRSGSDIFSFVAQMNNLDERKDFVEVAKLAASACGLGYMLDPNAPKIEPPIKTIAPNCTNYTKEDETPIYLNSQAGEMQRDADQTNLFTFLCRYWNSEEVKKVFALYQVGKGLRINKDNWQLIPMPVTLQRCNKCSSFPYIDEEGNTHAIKIIPYPVTDHHRIKVNDNWQMLFHKPEANKGVYFGTHLLPIFPNKPLALVESEKTACIGMLFAPQYIWIAVGGFEYFNPDSEKQRAKIDRLKGRCLHIFPDADKLTDWKERANKLREQGFNILFRDEVIKLFAPNSGIDIADVIIWEMDRLNRMHNENK